MRTVRGYTLPEVLIVIALFVVMYLVLSFFFVSSSTTVTYQSATIEVNGAASRVANAVRAAALPASRVLASQLFPNATVESTPEALVVELASIDEDGNIISGNYDQIAFYCEGSVVYQETAIDSGSARTAGRIILASNVSELSFTYDTEEPSTATLITVDVSTFGGSAANPATARALQTIYLRNTL